MMNLKEEKSLNGNSIPGTFDKLDDLGINRITRDSIHYLNREASLRQERVRDEG